jgi:hypothetical protein
MARISQSAAAAFRSEMRARMMPGTRVERGPWKALRSCSQSSSTDGMVAGTVSVAIVWARSTSVPVCVAPVGSGSGCGDQRTRKGGRYAARFTWGREGFAGWIRVSVDGRSGRRRPGRDAVVGVGGPWERRLRHDMKR